MKKILLFIAVCFSALSFSQPATKLDFYLAQKLDAYTNKRASSNTMLPMLIKGNIAKIKQLVQSSKGIFKYSAGNIAAIVIPLSALETFNASGFVTRMEGGPHHMHCLDDSSNAKMHVTEVLNGQPPLPQAYDGKGVVVGFIDSGIDYLHEDFRDSSGTRVKYYWDMNRYVNGYTPSPYGYGQSWTKAQIDASSGVDPNDSASIIDFGHGSNVAGAAVGNARCNGRELGAAPKADIIYVAYNFSTQTATMITDAVQYIYTCADSLNEPCVINISLGDYEGSHDDSDLQAEMMDSMILANRGRVLVASAGNDGYPYHLRDSMSAGDTNFTWFKYDGGIGIADIPIFSNKGDFTNVQFRLRCDKVQTGSYVERDAFTPYSTIASYMGFKTFNVYNALGQRLAQVQSYGQIYGTNSYSLEFQILPDSTSYYWGFQTIGPGKYDSWNLGSIIGVVDSVGLDINSITYPWMKHYTQPDSTETICSSFQCSPNVITAETYWNRKTYKDCTGNLQTNANPADHPGAFIYGYSKGPTRNKIHMKPDLTAAGQYTLAAIPTWLTGCNSVTDSLSCHMTDGGTSMAAPMVSGSVALYLERYPNANNHDVWTCFTSTASADAFTGPRSTLPNYNWGYGKLDADSALIYCGPTGTGVVHSINNCMLAAFPNPYSESTTITYDFSTITNYSKASIIVYNVIGKEVKAIELKSNSGNVTLDRATLASGMYFYSLMVDGNRLRTEKLEVL